jgi:NADPH-dependent 2,4-dienoyl-CoA reductase/sulfur reductase-like enzyme
MKFTSGIKIIISALMVWQSCLSKENKAHEADVCVYGGTASGVMAALAAKKEGAKVILIEPTRYLGGMTGGGIHHLDWGKGNTVGGSTFRLLTNGLRIQGKRNPTSVLGVGNKEYRERFRKAIDEAGIKVIYEHRLGNVQLGGKTIEHPTRKKPIAFGEDFSSKKKKIRSAQS